MQVNVTFRHMDPTEALKSYANEKVQKVTRYLTKAVDAHIVLSAEKYRKSADINILADGIQLRGQENSDDMYGSIDAAMEKIIRQVKRYREKIKRHKPLSAGEERQVQHHVFSLPDDEDGKVEHQIIETKTLSAKPMGVDEAVMQMDLIDNDFLVFTNATTDAVNVLYRLKDGNYGLIEATQR